MTYIDDINELIEAVDYGDVQVTVKRHTKNTHQVIIHSFESHKPKDNAQAAAIIMQVIKEATEKKFSGSLSFTVVLNKGKVSRLIKQDNAQIDYNKIDSKDK